MGEGGELIPLPQVFKDVQFTGEAEKKACVAVFPSIKRAMELTEAGVQINGQPMIVGLTNWHEFLDFTGGPETAWDPQLGIIHENVVFASTRDGWGKYGTYPYGSLTKHDKPIVKGIMENDRRYISVSGNNEGMSDFQSRALPSGAVEVRLFETDDIKILDGLDKEEREPRQDELDELYEIFGAVYSSLKAIVPKDNSTKKLP